jgi:hypothetical protein
MIGGNAKGGVASPPSHVTRQRQSLNVQAQVYPLPAQYSKPQSYRVDGRVLRFKGGMALMLDRMIAAQPNGIDRAATLQWIANIADTVMRLRGRGVSIATDRGQRACYRLLSDVERLERSQ